MTRRKATPQLPKKIPTKRQRYRLDAFSPKGEKGCKHTLSTSHYVEECEKIEEDIIIEYREEQMRHYEDIIEIFQYMDEEFTGQQFAIAFHDKSGDLVCIKTELPYTGRISAEMIDLVEILKEEHEKAKKEKEYGEIIRQSNHVFFLECGVTLVDDFLSQLRGEVDEVFDEIDEGIG